MQKRHDDTGAVISSPFSFEKATLTHKDMIFAWLDEPHVREFWDNSEDHRRDILCFLGGRVDKSGYFDDRFDYWIGSMNGDPHSFFLTAEFSEEDAGDPLWQEHRSKTGKTYTIDYCIGNTKYFGKGLGGPTLDAFTHYFKAHVDPLADTFYIDPDENNPRAKRVYEKAGFQDVGSYDVRNGFFKGSTSLLMVKKIAS